MLSARSGFAWPAWSTTSARSACPIMSCSSQGRSPPASGNRCNVTPSSARKSWTAPACTILPAGCSLITSDRWNRLSPRSQRRRGLARSADPRGRRRLRSRDQRPPVSRRDAGARSQSGTPATSRHAVRPGRCRCAVARAQVGRQSRSRVAGVVRVGWLGALTPRAPNTSPPPPPSSTAAKATASADPPATPTPGNRNFSPKRLSRPRQRRDPHARSRTSRHRRADRRIEAGGRRRGLRDVAGAPVKGSPAAWIRAESTSSAAV